MDNIAASLARTVRDTSKGGNTLLILHEEIRRSLELEELKTIFKTAVTTCVGVSYVTTVLNIVPTFKPLSACSGGALGCT